MKRLQQRLAELPARLRAPWTEDQLERLDAAVGAALPPALRAWLATAGPGSHIDLDVHRLRLDTAPRWAEAQGEWYRDEASIIDTREWLREVASDALPVAFDGAGNTLFLRREGDDATVWFHDHERETVVQVGESFIAWAHAELDRDLADPNRAHTALCTWQLPNDPGDVEAIASVLREAVGAGVVEQREHHGYPTITFSVGRSRVTASRNAAGNGAALCSVDLAHQTTEAGNALFERVAEVVRQAWPEAEMEREVI